MANKGLKLRLCRECKRKRFCKRERIPGYNFRYTCSKGHTWTIEGFTVERLNAAMESIIIPKLTDLFNRNDAFYRALKR